MFVNVTQDYFNVIFRLQKKKRKNGKPFTFFPPQLALLFRPHHTFCIHVDAKAPAATHKTVATMAECLASKRRQHPNNSTGAGAIILLRPPLEVYWGHISVLQAEITCLRALASSGRPWQYFLNLAGSELPSVPIGELERRVNALDGSSLADGEPMPEEHQYRILFSHKLDIYRNRCTPVGT